MKPRRKPYTEIGIRRLKCIRCGDPARTQWQICSDGNVFRPLCLACDFALNAEVMAFMGLPFDGAAYQAKLARDYPDKPKSVAQLVRDDLASIAEQLAAKGLKLGRVER